MRYTTGRVCCEYPDGRLVTLDLLEGFIVRAFDHRSGAWWVAS